MNIRIGLHVHGKTETRVNEYLEAPSPFVTVELDVEGGHGVSVFLHQADEAEIIGLEFLKAAKILREHHAKIDAANLAKWADAPAPAPDPAASE